MNTPVREKAFPYLAYATAGEMWSSFKETFLGLAVFGGIIIAIQLGLDLVTPGSWSSWDFGLPKPFWYLIVLWYVMWMLRGRTLTIPKFTFGESLFGLTLATLAVASDLVLPK